MTAVGLALAAAYGVHLLFSALSLGWTGVAPGPPVSAGRGTRHRIADWMVQAGLDEVRPVELAAVVSVLFLVGAAAAWALFGGVLPPLAGGGLAGVVPVAASRSRRDRRRSDAREAWPRMIEEIRIKTITLGRSIPQALLEVGQRAPDDMRPAFDAARREWLISTDFERTVAVLKAKLADATADAVCETLLVAHEIGGNDVDRCLTALIDDRIVDVQGRKDARSRQAGARFTRRFVVVVPLGMAFVGLSIGSGRSAYETPLGQLLVLVGLSLMAACWAWAGQIMRLPDEQRVLVDADEQARMR
jgi:tight adherence protein B